MSMTVHGELRLDKKMIGQACDLFSVLITAGYVVEARIVNNFVKTKDEIIFTIMTEDK